MPNLYKRKASSEPVRVTIRLSEDPNDTVTIWYKPREMSPAKDSAREMVSYWEVFHIVLADWDLSIPGNILEVFKKNAETVIAVKAKEKEVLELKRGSKERLALQLEIDTLKKSMLPDPEPDFSSGEVKVPLEEGVIAQLDYPLLTLLSQGLTHAMFPNLQRVEQSEGTF